MLAESSRKNRKAQTPDGRTNQMIALAIDEAERMLKEGNAPPSVVVHYLKLADPRTKLETDILSAQKDLIVAKTDAIHESHKLEELYNNAMEAMSSYRSSDV